MNDIVIKIGELLVRAGIVTGVDLSEAEKLAKHMNLQFGQVLIMSGCLSEHDLDCALVAQQLIREELLTVDVACRALALASQHQMPFENALEALNVVPKYGTASVEMAELLADAAIIPGELLEQALMTSLATSVSLGELLVREHAISSSLIPVLNVMLADISAGNVQQEQAINEIRKNHHNWQRGLQSGTDVPVSPAPVRAQEPSPVFVSQELMHAYESYQPQQQAQPPQQNHLPPQPQPASQPQYQQPSQPASPPAYQQQATQSGASAPHLQPVPPQAYQNAPSAPQGFPQPSPAPLQGYQQPAPPTPPPGYQQPPQTPPQGYQQSPQPTPPQGYPQPPQTPQPYPQQSQPTGYPQQTQSSPPAGYPQLQAPSSPSQPSSQTPQASPSPAPLSIHDVLSMFQQRNPVSESSTQAVPKEQQAASWSAFVQSQSFDPNDVEPTTPPLSVAADEARLRHPEEVVQGTYAKTFDGKKSAELLAETFEQPVPDFEPAAEVIAAGEKTSKEPRAEKEPEKEKESQQEPERDDSSSENEQFHLLVELLIEASYFDREDIIESISNALKDESKAVKLLKMLGLADARTIMAASICADALGSNELTSGEALAVLGDIKDGAEIHEALESVNLELAVTVSANLQMMFDDEVDESFYVGDVSRTVDIFEPDDFAEEPKSTQKDAAPVVNAPPAAVAQDDTPPIAFGYGRERLKIAKRTDPQMETPKDIPAASPAPAVTPTVEPAAMAQSQPVEADRSQTVIGGKKVSSLSEVFEKLSGVENTTTAATPAPVAAPPVTPLAAPTPPQNRETPPSTGFSPPSRTGTPAVAKSSSPNEPVFPVDAANQENPSSDNQTSSAWSGPVAENANLAASTGPSSDLITAADSSAAAPEIDKKTARKRNSTTFNSLQAVFVPSTGELAVTSDKEEAVESPAATEDSSAQNIAAVSAEASSEYAAYTSKTQAEVLKEEKADEAEKAEVLKEEKAEEAEQAEALKEEEKVEEA
ncbi:MAG: hypothetical protein JST44_25415, partial [Cyanobacteria bacterium SZAS LIN-5]|nr:hypothetical protein [Cyanobacteria bacterium SZAS LIN-5]